MSTRELFEREALPQLSSLRSFASSLCRDRHRAEDLVQETMLKAYRYFDSYQQGTNCRAWLFQICKHSYINAYRRRRLEPVTIDLQGEPDQQGGEDEIRSFHPALPDSTDVPAAAPALGDEVASALKGIPPDYQTALLLSDIEGYSYEEIADFTRVPIGTVRSRIHRARKLMAGSLTDYARRNRYIASH